MLNKCARGLILILFALGVSCQPALVRPPAYDLLFCAEQAVYIASIRSDDQTQIRRSLDLPEGSMCPVWSPDGKRIAFISSEFAAKEYTRRITLMNRDGSHLTDLAEGGGAPSWSPDGRYIVYRDVRGNLAVVNAQSGEVTSLEGDGSRGGGFGPVWSPDGQHIAFTAYTSYLNGHEEIYVVAADGTDETRLTYGATHSSNPTWSPDGKRIAFSSLKDFRPEETGSGYWAIELMDADGSNRVQLTRHESGWATWTPDGQHLIFPHYYDDKTSMFVIGVDGGAETQLATLPWSGELSFSPDRQRVALVREGIPITVHSKRIWIAAVDGSSETRLTRQE